MAKDNKDWKWLSDNEIVLNKWDSYGKNLVEMVLEIWNELQILHCDNVLISQS